MRVSIVICNYNYAAFLEGALRSALEQTHADTEVVVVDDGSTDDSLQILDRYRDKVQVIQQANQGQCAAANRGFEASSGEVLIFLDSDDVLEPDAVSEIVGAFADSRVAKVHYRLNLIDAHGRPIGISIPRHLDDGDLSVPIRRGVSYDSSPGTGNAYRRSVLERLMPLPSTADDRHGADYYCIVGSALLGSVRAIDIRPLARYRVHSNDASGRVGFGNASLEEAYKAQRRHKVLRAWLVERLGEGYRISDRLSDFGIQKQIFADKIFSSDSYLVGTRDGWLYLRQELATSIWSRRGARAEKIGLMGWALAVATLPRSLGRPVARYVCNPASRKPLAQLLGRGRAAQPS